MSDHDSGDHTAEVKSSRAEAEQIAQELSDQGWDVYPERVPLQGQWGFYCVQSFHSDDGHKRQKAYSVRWNLFDTVLTPIEIDTQHERDILSFIWTHAGHSGFDYFEYGDGDVGFVCHCQGDRGKSIVLRIGSEVDHLLSDDAFELLWIYENANAVEE
jgi:hypothetical protein